MSWRVTIPAAFFLVALAFAGWRMVYGVPYELSVGRAPSTGVLAGPDLGLGEHALEGVVLDASGVPAQGAFVVIVEGERPNWTYTGEDGQFVLREVSGPEPVQVHVLVRDHVPQSFPVAFAPAPTSLRMARRAAGPADLLPAPASDLTGSAVLPDDALAVGYEVLLVPTRPPSLEEPAVPRRVLVDGDGDFVLPDLVHGRYRIHLLPPWAVDGTWPDLLTPLGGPPRVWSHPEDGSAELRSASGAIRGTLVDAEGGRVQGGLVRVEPILEEAEGLPFPNAVTDAEGRWLLRDLPPALYRVSWTAGSLNGTREIRVTPGVTVSADDR